MSTTFYDIAVIGAGASGLMAAIAAAKEKKGLSLAILEKNDRAGVKLLATGNGRCNYLNRNAAPTDYYSSLEQAPLAVSRLLGPGAVEGLMEDFRLLGIEPMEEAAGRMYPRSQQAASVVKALTAGALRSGAEFFFGFSVIALDRLSDGYVLTAEDGRKVRAKKVILALGGKAGIQFGTAGDGFRIARNLGLKTEKAVPALTKLAAAESLKELAGVRAEAVIALVETGSGAPVSAAEDWGEVQFTEDCLSGICSFNVSRFYRFFDGASYIARLDLMQEYRTEDLKALLAHRKQLFAEEPAEMLLMGLLPAKLAAYLLKKAGLGAEPAGKALLCRNIAGEKLSLLAELCKGLEIPLSGTKSWKEAQVTKGGVSLEEVNPNTLEAEKYPGLYITGEALDVDGPCGGYNLTWAFASGKAAGTAAARG